MNSTGTTADHYVHLPIGADGAIRWHSKGKGKAKGKGKMMTIWFAGAVTLVGAIAIFAITTWLISSAEPAKSPRVSTRSEVGIFWC